MKRHRRLARAPARGHAKPQLGFIRFWVLYADYKPFRAV